MERSADKSNTKHISHYIDDVIDPSDLLEAQAVVFSHFNINDLEDDVVTRKTNKKKLIPKATLERVFKSIYLRQILTLGLTLVTYSSQVHTYLLSPSFLCICSNMDTIGAKKSME